ncbi:MAG: hypothetical protein PWQ45_145 [Thermosipho sp. (in: thermotogales)]|nr:hypothetical protein [Thermosipho sp. (in: thermotogales)]
MNGNRFTAYYVISHQIYANKMAFMGGSEDLILWRVYINRNKYFKYNEIQEIIVEPVKVLTEREANRLVKKGFRNKRVLIASNVMNLEEEFYEMDYYRDDGEKFRNMPKKEYSDIGFVEMVRDGERIF